MSNNGILSGKVAAILNLRELAINIGSIAGVKVDMIFKILGETILKDPDTDDELGNVQYEKGKVKIVKVEEKFSVARTFETYETNIGGMGALGDFNKISEANMSIFSPPKWVTKVQTLKYDETDIDLPEPTNKAHIYIQKGDLVIYTND